jgi:hypothetical protein
MVLVSAQAADGISLLETFDFAGSTIEEMVSETAHRLRDQDWEVETRSSAVAVVAHLGSPTLELGVWDNARDLDASLNVHYARRADLNFIGFRIMEGMEALSHPGTLVLKNYERAIVCDDIPPNSDPQEILALLRDNLERNSVHPLTQVPGFPGSSPEDLTLVLNLDEEVNLSLIDPIPAEFSFFLMGADGGPMLRLVLPTTPFDRGDIDGSGTLDITDVAVLLEILFRGAPLPSCVKAADTNDDGSLNVTDAIYLFAHLVLGGPVLPPPEEVCGFEWTTDSLPGTGTNCTE